MLTCCHFLALTAVSAFVFVFILPSRFDNASFVDFMREDNYVGHLLTAHLFLLDYLLGQSGISVNDIPEFGGRKGIVLAWIRKLANRLPANLEFFADFLTQTCNKFETYDSSCLPS